MEWMKLNRLRCLQLPKKYWREMSFAVNPCRLKGGAPCGGDPSTWGEAPKSLKFTHGNELRSRCVETFEEHVLWLHSKFQICHELSWALKVQLELTLKHNFVEIRNIPRSVKGCNHQLLIYYINMKAASVQVFRWQVWHTSRNEGTYVLVGHPRNSSPAWVW